MTLQIIATYLIGVFLLIGAFFALVGAIGLLKFNDSMTRLHAPTKVGTLGVGSILFGSMIYFFAYGSGSIHELLIMAFLFATAPISANFIAKVVIHRENCDTPPAPDRDKTWSTLDVPKADQEISEQQS
ncbi:MAG: Na+/H+ antiporter subunit G [Paracoccaceae bacterium]